MNHQKVFDKVITHLLEQGHAALDSAGNVCQYKASDGSRCAVGCLIPSSKYNHKMENHSLCFWHEKFKKQFTSPIEKVLGVKTDADLNFLSKLQNMHDSDGRYTTDVVSFRRAIRVAGKRIAYECNLQWNHE